MDKINRRILRILESEGRISNTDLSTRVGLSPSACLRRVQELERTGVIRGYRAVLDPEQLGIGFVAFVAVGLNDHSKPAQDAFEMAISAAPEVRECHNVTGSFEYLLRVECEDMGAYKVFHSEVLGSIPEVNAITSYAVMDSPKDLRA